jgi:hypothetical protein
MRLGLGSNGYWGQTLGGALYKFVLCLIPGFQTGFDDRFCSPRSYNYINPRYLRPMRHPLTGRLRSLFGRYASRPFEQLLRSPRDPDQMAYLDLVRC